MGFCFYLKGGKVMWKTHWKDKYKYTFCVCMFFLRKEIGLISNVFKQFHTWIGCL